jgi:MFS family permease
MRRIARLGRHIVMDVSPLRRSRDLRCLVAGQLLSTLGAQLTVVAVPYQVYALTRSSLDVGLLSLAQVVPLIVGALLGSSLADAVDRRKILLVAQSLTLLCSAGLAVNANTPRSAGLGRHVLAGMCWPAGSVSGARGRRAAPAGGC